MAMNRVLEAELSYYANCNGLLRFGILLHAKEGNSLQKLLKSAHQKKLENVPNHGILKYI